MSVSPWVFKNALFSVYADNAKLHSLPWLLADKCAAREVDVHKIGHCTIAVLDIATCRFV